jgi:hypothetical protein
MKVYADTSATFARQLLADALFVGWVVLWVWIGNVVHDALAEPGLRAESSATSLSESMTDAGSFLEDVPLIGDGAATPFEKAADASQSLADAGRATADAVERLAFWLGTAIAVIPLLIVGLYYLPRRIRFVREASAGQRFVDGPADLELFALRAMSNRPLHVLARVTDDPVGALRRGDAAVIAALARIELNASGLQHP